MSNLNKTSNKGKLN